MKKYNLRVNFPWNGMYDMWEFRITVPNNVTVEEVTEALLKAHDDFKKECSDASPVELLDYVNGEYGWQWEDFYYDIELDMK